MIRFISGVSYVWNSSTVTAGHASLMSAWISSARGQSWRLHASQRRSTGSGAPDERVDQTPPAPNMAVGKATLSETRIVMCPPTASRTPIQCRSSVTVCFTATMLPHLRELLEPRRAGWSRGRRAGCGRP